MNKLFLTMLDYKPNNNFYTTKEEKLTNLIDTISKTDTETAIIISWYLSKYYGIKLSPVITNTFLFEKVQDEYRDLLKFVIRDTYTRPDFIGNSLEFYEDYFKIDMKNIPNSLKNTYTKVLESYSDTTLKKFKMKNRRFTLADMIKIFRPNPKKAKNLIDKGLYKNIIENKASLCKETITDILSDSTLSKKEKDTLINDKIEFMPINQIIKNLVNIKYEDNAEIVKNKLIGCLNKPTAFRYLNPYDLIFNSEDIDNRWIVLVDNILKEWLSKFFENTNQEYVILFDISGSMNNRDYTGNTGVQSGAKFLSLILPILNEFSFYTYNSNIYNNHKLNNLLHNKNTPNQIYKTLSDISKSASGWTLTKECLNKIAEVHPNANIILITDEVSYDDSDEFTEDILNPLIVYCTDMSQSGLFDMKENSLRICGCNGNILYTLKQFLFFDTFMKEITEKFYTAFNKYKNRK